jgi:hypothetical protein
MRFEVLAGGMQRQADFFGNNSSSACLRREAIEQGRGHVMVMNVNNKFRRSHHQSKLLFPR